MSLLDEIPGYRAAVERENAIRDAAFLDLPETICGIEARPLSSSMFLALDGAGSPFIAGQAPDAEDVAIFLWFASTEYSRTDTEARSKFIDQCKRIDFERACREINSYLSDAFQDAPPDTVQGDVIPIASWVTNIIDLLAREYGWSEASILAMPLKRAWQYVRRIQRRHNPRHTLFNPSDRVRGNWLRALNESKG